MCLAYYYIFSYILLETNKYFILHKLCNFLVIYSNLYDTYFKHNLLSCTNNPWANMCTENPHFAPNKNVTLSEWATYLSSVGDDGVVSESNRESLDAHLLLGVCGRESSLLVGVVDDDSHAVLVDVNVGDVGPPHFVEGEETVSVRFHRLNDAVCRHQDRAREVGPLKLLELPRPTPMAHQVLRVK